MQTLMSVDVGTLTIFAKGMRHSIEGRGIIDTGGMELPHAEIIETFRYPELDFAGFRFADSGVDCAIPLSVNGSYSDYIPYPIIDARTFRLRTEVIYPHTGSIITVPFVDTTKVEVIGDGVVSKDGTSIGVYSTGETIVKYKEPIKVHENTIINIVETEIATASILPGILAIAYSNDNEHWFYLDENVKWASTDLSFESMQYSWSTVLRSSLCTFEQWHELINGSNSLYVAVYMRAEFSSEAMTLKSLQIFTQTKE
jgi:hypothetical protein